ncbi:DsbA family protein [Nonomuraea sediminis]|uniref:DsbA family protein n=1 Tax=Nonomuraea sediminis TaxID=2835864 RepID=UPI001BDD4788|nr:thioredoxin domain-containing protein [Nonomuraea sediminis]
MSREERRAKIEAVREEGRRQDTRRRNLQVSLVVVGVFALAAAAFLVISRPGDAKRLAAGESLFVRKDSHKLQTAADGKVTLVEFLDFECEACKAYFPTVEQLRKQYAGKVTFVARYFPIAGHFNAERAARAVEAAARQGKFEPMYQQMYQTQGQWAEKRVPADAFFRQLAQRLRLDMAAWDKAYDDPATLARVKKDAADGQALGVQGTPTFFLNGKKLEPRSSDEFKAAIDAALAK